MEHHFGWNMLCLFLGVRLGHSCSSNPTSLMAAVGDYGWAASTKDAVLLGQDRSGAICLQSLCSSHS